MALSPNKDLAVFVQPLTITREFHASLVPEVGGATKISIFLFGRLASISLHLLYGLSISTPSTSTLAAKVDVDGKLVENPYKKWSDIDASLPNKKIEILVAPPTSGTRDAWNSLVMVKGCSKSAKSLFGDKAKKECAKIREDGYAVEAGENDTLIVQKLTSNPDAYGFFGYSYLVANKDKVKAASIEGVQPSLEGIQDYSYPIARPLFFYVKKAHIGVIPGIQEFLKEFTSKKAMSNRGYLAKIGLVPLASEEYKTTRSAALDLNIINIK